MQEGRVHPRLRDFVSISGLSLDSLPRISGLAV